MHAQENHSSPDYDTTPVDPDDGGKIEYALEDFSQQAINRGQQRINYEFTVVNRMLAKALEELRDAIAGTPAGAKIDFEEVDEAIAEVYKATQKIPGYYPPGCFKGTGSQ